MDDFVVVLNAGSSSLKFCTYSRAQDDAWRLAGRGQIEGIGTSPRFSAKDGDGTKVVDQALGDAVRDASGVLDALAEWLRRQHPGPRIVGVGHRVVHGEPTLPTRSS